MRILGIDYGDARIGLALSDASATLCGRAWTLTEWNLDRAVAAIADVVRTEGVERIVLGLPKNMDGTQGERCDIVRAFAEEIKKVVPDVKIIFWDERLSTVAAAKSLIAADVSRAKRRKVIDKMAAVFILQGYLDGHPF